MGHFHISKKNPTSSFRPKWVDFVCSDLTFTALPLASSSQGVRWSFAAWPPDEVSNSRGLPMNGKNLDTNMREGCQHHQPEARRPSVAQQSLWPRRCLSEGETRMQDAVEVLLCHLTNKPWLRQPIKIWHVWTSGISSSSDSRVPPMYLPLNK